MIKNLKKILWRINNSFKLKMIICVVSCFLIIFIFFIINKNIEVKKFRLYNITNDIKLMNAIENISAEKKEIQIEGYAFLLDMNTDGNVISIFLLNTTTGKEIWLDVTQVNRNNISNYYESEYNYINSGFIAKTSSKAIKADEIYEIIINIDYNEANNSIKRKTASTNRYIFNGELYAYNPNEFETPNMNVKSELIKEVFTKGQLCMYQKEEGIYIYQYNDKLYWITTEDFRFNEDKATHIVYHLHTSQIDKLPKHRVQYKFDNLDFYFEHFEYIDEETNPYRIAIRDIPKEYAITYINTGVYNKDVSNYSWSKKFHLY